MTGVFSAYFKCFEAFHKVYVEGSLGERRNAKYLQATSPAGVPVIADHANRHAVQVRKAADDGRAVPLLRAHGSDGEDCCQRRPASLEPSTHHNVAFHAGAVRCWSSSSARISTKENM